MPTIPDIYDHPLSDPPYDRALALASLVKTMRHHYLDVRCNCGAQRVIGLGQMAKDRRTANLTMAHVALRLACERCENGPDAVYLTATIYGIGPPPYGGGGLVWIMPLVERPSAGTKRLRGTPETRAAEGSNPT